MRDTVSSRPRRTRRIVLWTLLSVVMVAVLAVGGITVYNQLNEDELPEDIVGGRGAQGHRVVDQGPGSR